MSKLVIHDLPKNIELDRTELKAVHGGSRRQPFILDEPDVSIASTGVSRVGGKMHLEDVTLGIITDKA